MFIQFTILAQLFQIAFASKSNPDVKQSVNPVLSISGSTKHCILFETLVSDFRKCFATFPVIFSTIHFSELEKQKLLGIKLEIDKFIPKNGINDHTASTKNFKKEFFDILERFRTIFINNLFMNVHSVFAESCILQDVIENSKKFDRII